MTHDRPAGREGYATAAQFLPHKHSLAALRSAAADCQGCPLYRRATQTVFGKGTDRASIVLIGEQPGDQEDRTGHPFVGPAGRLLDQALDEAGIDRPSVYVTNAVKHFKWVERGKRRLHAKPSAREAAACRPWLEAELATIEPQVVVCLGATAAQSMLGAKFRITRERGTFIASASGGWTVATYHPAAILRAPDEASRRSMRATFIEDLRAVRMKARSRKSSDLEFG